MARKSVQQKPSNTSKKIRKKTKQDNQKLKNENTPLNPRQQLFVNYYIETGNGAQAAIQAGYSEKTARITASKLLTLVNVKHQIQLEMEKINKNSIATAQEVMEYFTRVMKGEEKDQFGLDAPLSERTRAAQELAKRTIDLENRVNGKQVDSVVQIKLDWSRD